MPNEPSMPPNAAGGSRLSNWFWILVIVLIFGVSWWQNRQPLLEQPAGQNPDSREVSTTSGSGSSESLPNPDEPQHPPVSSERDHSGDSETAPVPPGRSIPSNGERPSGSVSTNPNSRTAPGSSRNSTGPLSERRHRTSHEKSSDASSTHEANPNRKAESQSEHSVRVENQTIRDLNGNVAYKGTIDLTATLDRIERGEANRHRNDGTTFQNREGRLPRKPAGYYKEYVHPTPGENGPGPQRVIVGQEGEIWYTPDHYKSFREIRTAKHTKRQERGPDPNDS